MIMFSLKLSNEDFPDYSPTQWQLHIINLIHAREAEIENETTYLHPVGMTIQYNGSNDTLWNSPADWISLWGGGLPIPSPPDTSLEVNPLAASGDKVVILDTDHLRNNLFDYRDGNRPGYPVDGDFRARRSWVWKSFTRGYNPIYMDEMYDGTTPFGGAQLNFDYLFGALTTSPYRDEVRDAMGDTRIYADRMNLVDMIPQAHNSASPSSTRYCLALVGEEYLVYQPQHEEFTVSLPANTYAVEWFDPHTGEVVSEPDRTVIEDADEIFTMPDWLEEKFEYDAVLFLTIYERDHILSRPRG